MAQVDAPAIAVLQDRVAQHAEEIDRLRARSHEYGTFITTLQGEVESVARLTDRVDEATRSVVALEASIRMAGKLALLVVPIASAAVSAVTAFVLSRAFAPPDRAVARVEDVRGRHHDGPEAAGWDAKPEEDRAKAAAGP